MAVFIWSHFFLSLFSSVFSVAHFGISFTLAPVICTICFIKWNENWCETRNGVQFNSIIHIAERHKIYDIVLCWKKGLETAYISIKIWRVENGFFTALGPPPLAVQYDWNNMSIYSIIWHLNWMRLRFALRKNVKTFVMGCGARVHKNNSSIVINVMTVHTLNWYRLWHNGWMKVPHWMAFCLVSAKVQGSRSFA